MINNRKKQEGITLIALVITIIVLLILAGIAISMISGNNGVLTKVTDAKRVNEQGTEEDRVRLAVQSALIDGLGIINLTKHEGNEPLVGLEKALAEEFGTESPVVTEYTEGKVTIGDKKYSVSTTGLLTEIKWTWTDNDEEGTEGYEKISVGDLIEYKAKTSEKFYVIGFSGANNSTVKVLAAKNITTTGTLQQGDSTHTAPPVAFSDTNYWSNETSYPLDLNTYTDKTEAQKIAMGVKSDDAIEIARRYASETFGVTGKLMTLEEICSEEIGANSEGNTTYGCPLFINSTDYWLGSAISDDSVWFVAGEGSFVVSDIYSGGGYYGVRPVIEVSTFSIE